jgi:TusA-related sulfurtransferase
MAHRFDETLDAKGLKCPLPLVQSRKAILNLPVGGVLRVVATDRGSLADFQGWTRVAKNIELLDQETTHEGGQDLYIHYVRRTV